MNKYYKNKVFSLSIITLALIAVVMLYTARSNAQESQVSFPVKELGNCQDKESCKEFCDKSGNGQKCLDFARKHDLMSEAEIKVAESILLEGGGPGKCSSKASCEAYCDNIANIDQCVSFAEKHNVISPEELDEARKIQSALKRGIVPPSCKNKKACDTYCSEPENMEICMNFAVEAGFMSDSEKADAQKMLQAIKKGVKPLPCKGKNECEVYCSEENNLEQCISFAESAGFMTSEQAERSRKTGGKGPGGCKGKECETFCNDQNNQETCFRYSVDNGLMPEEDLEKMREGKKQMINTMEQAPSEVVACVKAKIGEGEYQKIMNEQYSRQTGDPFRECFDKYMSNRPPQGEMMRPPEGMNQEQFQQSSPAFEARPEMQSEDMIRELTPPQDQPIESRAVQTQDVQILEPEEAPVSEPAVDRLITPPSAESTSPQSLLPASFRQYSLATVFESIRNIIGGM